jgi:predicted transcriptional regulator
MRKTETLSLRVSGEFKRRLAELAKSERRSITNYLEATVEKLWSERSAAETQPKEVTQSQDPKD